MNPLLLVLLLAQAGASVDSHVEGFLKGKAAARAELVKLGAYAILPLRKVRDKAPEKVDELLHELKKAAAFPAPSDFVGDFGGTITIEGDQELKQSSMMSTIWGGKTQIFLDEFDPARLKSKTYSLSEVKSALEIAREVCRQTGLDYGYFHNHIVLGMPERLWPAGAPPPTGELSADDQKKAKALVALLNGKTLDIIENAESDLLKFGPRLISLLESQLKRKETEIVDRCRGLISRLRPRAGVFGPTAAARQGLDEGGRKTLRLAGRSLQGQGWFENRTLEGLAAYVKEKHQVTVDIGPHGERTVTIGLTGRVIDFLSLTAQSLDLDIAVRGSDLVIDTREAIEKMIAGGK